MDGVTIEDRKKELRVLLNKIQAFPSQGWDRERQRVVVLQEMIAAEERKAHA